MILTFAQVMGLAIAIGFTEPEAATVACIAKYESNYRPHKVSPKNRNGTFDYGLMQINSIWRKSVLCDDLDLLSPIQNMTCTYRIYKVHNKSFRPWVAYKKNRRECDQAYAEVVKGRREDVYKTLRKGLP